MTSRKGTGADAVARRATLLASALLLATALSACGGGSRHGAAWDGRRGYNGNGDYGYDLNAPRTEASGYRWGMARAYAVPGTPDDPWGPYIREAAARFGVPELWIREVMRQESGGRATATSRAGAMGLMQVMPRTYETLRRRHGLGSDPYEPRDNILAGTAYIRQMHDRYGAPGFLAAYNAGPERVDAVLAGAMILPDETVNYLASVAPRLGMGTAMSGPFATYASGTRATGYSYASASEADLAYAGGGMRGTDLAYAGGGILGTDLAYAGGGMRGADYFMSGAGMSVAGDPSLRAFEGGGLVTPEAPTGTLGRLP